jgi:hypothetical protein
MSGHKVVGKIHGSLPSLDDKEREIGFSFMAGDCVKISF